MSDIVRYSEGNLSRYADDMAKAGEIANYYARSDVWKVYHESITENTARRQRNDLASYCQYLAAAGIHRTAQEMYDDPRAWAGTTHGLLKGYREWALQQGLAMGTVNVRLATLRRYCQLAGPAPDGAGVLNEQELGLLLTVKGFSGKQARNRDRDREVKRVGNKKADATAITIAQALALKKATTPRPRATKNRDALLVGLLVEHAFRCGEVASLDIEMFDTRAGQVTLYREKTDQVETHKLKTHTLMALETYLSEEKRTSGPLFLGNEGKRISRRAINARVQALGEQVGIADGRTLSPHDLRHFWAFDALRNGTPLDQVKSGGGWKSDSMVLRYAKRAGIANEGVIITEEQTESPQSWKHKGDKSRV